MTHIPTHEANVDEHFEHAAMTHTQNSALFQRTELYLATIAVVLCALAWDARATVYQLFPTGLTSDCDEQLENIWNSAQPGDEIILNAGVYAQGCARRIVNDGTAAAPIVVRAADGADVLITRPESTSTQHNNIEITGSYLVIRGLRFQYGSGGVSFVSGNNITFEDNEVFDTYDNAIRLNSGNTDSFIIRNNHIHHTGIAGSTGEGMYVGCHPGDCIASNHLIEGNYLHDLESQSGGGNDGIEIKYRSHGNIIRGNLIHDTTIGQDFPCIFVYGHGDGAPNIIEDNFVFNCGEAILVTADAIVRNNIVLNSTVNGIHINRQNPAPNVQNVTVVNNTVYGSHPTCARLNVGSGVNVTVANNAFYCENSTAVSGNLGSATLLGNYVAGSMASGSIDNLQFIAGGSSSNAFVDAGASNFRLLPGSVLVDAGNASVQNLPAKDHDGNARISGATIDVGAFELVTATLDLFTGPLISGEPVTINISGARAGRRVFVGVSTAGIGQTPAPALAVQLALDSARLIASAFADSAGDAQVTVTVPVNSAGTEVWLQAAEFGNTSNVIMDTVGNSP